MALQRYFSRCPSPKIHGKLSTLLALFLVLCAMNPLPGAQDVEGVTLKDFGVTAQGDRVKLYILENKHRLEVKLMNYGATIQSLLVPDRSGNVGDIALGFDNFAPYPTKSPYFGAVVGRYGNRISHGRFFLGGKLYQLALNDPPNSLHGGWRGFDKRMWKATIVSQKPPSVQFSRISPDGEENYPGTLHVKVTYTLSDDNRLTLSYEAHTDRDTVLNLTNHTYFDLAGQGVGTIGNHLLRINATSFTPVDKTLIPTGAIEPVLGTPWDFTSSTPIGKSIKSAGGNPVGFDINYVLSSSGSGLHLAAEVAEPSTGRTMTLFTDQPGLQFYTGNFLDGTLIGKGGKRYLQYGAFCLETQHFPDSPNHPNFPSTTLRAGQTFKSTTVYAFGVK